MRLVMSVAKKSATLPPIPPVRLPRTPKWEWDWRGISPDAVRNSTSLLRTPAELPSWPGASDPASATSFCPFCFEAINSCRNCWYFVNIPLFNQIPPQDGQRTRMISRGKYLSVKWFIVAPSLGQNNVESCTAEAVWSASLSSSSVFSASPCLARNSSDSSNQIPPHCLH